MSHDGRVLACCLGPAGELPPGTDRLAFDGDSPAPERLAGVVLERGSEARARQLLAEGAARVYLGEAALRDSTALERLAAEFGSARLGVYAAARRMPVLWTLESVSNADFRYMTPSRCDPCWELLTASREGTGTDAGWWLGEMCAVGASSALLRVDMLDDTDLDILARLVERLGERLWVGPLEDTDPALQDWVSRAGAHRLALPRALLSRVQTADAVA